MFFRTAIVEDILKNIYIFIVAPFPKPLKPKGIFKSPEDFLMLYQLPG